MKKYSKFSSGINKRIIMNFIIMLMVIIQIIFTVVSYSTDITNLFGGGIVKIVIITASILSFLAMLILCIQYNNILKSIKNINNSANRLLDGELNIDDIEIWENNDFKVLAKAFNQMKSNLLFFIDNTKKNVINLSNSIEKVSASMEISEKGSEQVAITTQNISQSSQYQLGLVKDTVAKNDDIYRSIDKISMSIKGVESVAADFNEISIKGMESLREHEENIKSISDSMIGTGQFISALRENVSQITSVTNFILDIGEQLKLLSLNASIESARSGEAGKGFSVVANEITTLSESTTSEIAKINNIVTSILESSKNVESSIIKSNNDFENSWHEFVNVKDVFSNIENKSLNVINEINNVGAEVFNINAIAKETATMSQKVYDSSYLVSGETEGVLALIEEQLAESQLVNQAVFSLKDFIDKMQKSTSMFDIGIKPVENNSLKHLRLAIIIFEAIGSEFWTKVTVGASYAKRELSEKNTTVDIKYITSKVPDCPEDYANIIRQCREEKYDGICLAAYSEELITAVTEVVDSGIPVMAYNCDFPKENKRIACVRQNAYQSGVAAARAILRDIKGKGRVIVMSWKDMNTDAHLRYKGFQDTIKKNNKRIAIESQVTGNSGEETYEKVKEFLKENKDVNAIYLISKFKFFIAKAIEELGLGGKIKFITYDLDTETIKYLRKGIISCTIGQDPFGQGRDSLIHLHNYLVTGKKPDQDEIWSRIEIFDAENVRHIFD